MKLRISLLIEGILSYISTRNLTQDEINDQIGNYLLLSPNLPDWNPHTNDYEDKNWDVGLQRKYKIRQNRGVQWR